LAEIGRRANPPLGKSAVNHRLRRLVKLAEEVNPGFN
jgi:DNA-binding transcriptional regulator WhiA